MPCPASTRLMRESMSGQQTVSVGNASVELVPMDVMRIALVISAPKTNPVYLALRTAAADQTGIALAAGGPPLVLNLGDHGALVQGPINAICPAGTEPLTIWTTNIGPIRG